MRKRNLLTGTLLGLILAFVLWPAQRAYAQASGLENGPPPPPGAEAPAKPSEPSAGPEAPAAPREAAGPVDATKPPEAPAPVEPPEPVEPQWDPVAARKNLEIGGYFLRTGNYKAAVDRLQEAARLQPGLAEPFRLLGRVYEKERDPKKAMEAYRKYLEAYPTAPDHSAVTKQIEKLGDEVERQAKK